MAIQARVADYSPDIAPPIPAPEIATPRNGQALRTKPREGTGGAELLQLLARAIQQFHTYPATSPLCQTAVEACHRAVLALGHGDRLTFRVTPRELIVNEVATGRGTLIEQELARRLHASHIAQVTIERTVSVRELSRFCRDLARWSDTPRRGERHGLIELLADHGINRITVRRAYHPEVLQVAPPAPPVAALIEQQRTQRALALQEHGVADHLYPPDRGWVRVDPASTLQDVSLIDLAVLADNPGVLAAMLLRLTDEEASEMAGEDALLEKFSEIATLFDALDSGVARVMFGKLARAVLDLDPDRRQALLRRTILPGLLDGRVAGTVLRDFPDVDLAESLCLLLDLETAAPELVITALSRLDLPAERDAAVRPLLEARLNAPAGPRETSIDAHARKLVRIDHGQARSFTEFAAFDLALDERTATALGGVGAAIATSDFTRDQLECLWNLVRLEPNPELVQRFVVRVMRLIEELDQAHRWRDLADWLSQYRDLAESLREPRPDVAEVLATMSARLCTPQRARAIVDLAGDPEGLADAGRLVAALGPEIAVSLLGVIQSRAGENTENTWRVGVQLLCDHAPLVAPALVPVLDHAHPSAARAIARVLGLAGRGYEAPLVRQLGNADEQTVREALRSLVRIGTAPAAAAVAARIEKDRGWLATAAEEALWRFPPPEVERQVRALLTRREFVFRRPGIAVRLLERTSQGGAAGLETVLSTLAPLRFRIWKPALARLGRRAHALAHR